jgi:DNA-binding transcriptional regulator YiaG
VEAIVLDAAAKLTRKLSKGRVAGVITLVIQDRTLRLLTTEWEDHKPLHYNWCGLDDIYLLSGYKRIRTDDGDDIIIQDMDGLHRAIGTHLALHKKTLNGKEVRFLRHQMDLSQKELGKILRVTDQTVARWEKGEILVPGPKELLLRITYMAFVKGTTDESED